jgi:predicted Zn-dependent protease
MLPEKGTREFDLINMCLWIILQDMRTDPRKAKMRFIKTAIVAVLVMVLSPLGGYPSSLCHASLTPAEEEELGREFMRYVRKNLALIEDPSIVNYVNKVGQRILAQYPSPPFDFHFYVVKEEVYNAFAAPAGHVFINSGLLAAMDDEEELAGIIGHEIAHVLCRHISKRIEQSKKIGWVTLAGMLTGIFLGGNPEVSSAITTGSLAAGQSLSLMYSREDERQADQVGLKYLTKAGYGGEGLLEMLNKIREKRWFGSEQIPSYVMTHPAVEERMGYLDTWIQAHPEWRGRGHANDSKAFHKVRTKLVALYGDTTAAHNAFDVRLRKDAEDVLANYGKGLLLAREGRKKEAVESLKKAARLRPLDADILRDLGKTYFQGGDYPEAFKWLREALALNPEDPEGRLLLGRSQIETGDLEGALETLKGLVKSHPDYLSGTYYFGETYGKLGNLAEAHYHLGMYYKEKGELKNARFHLTRALKLFGKDPVRQQAIKEALSELRGNRQPDHSEKTAW